MNKHPSSERTLAVIKPDGVERSLIGDIINRIERTGLKLIAIKMFIPTPEFVETHYTFDPHWKRKAGEKSISSYHSKGEIPWSDNPIEVGERVLGYLKKYLSDGPVVAMVWKGAHAVGVVRKLVGSTEPMTSDVGTIRGDYMIDSYELSDKQKRSIRNLIHASGNAEEAEQEIKLWFKDEELIEYTLLQEKILYS